MLVRDDPELMAQINEGLELCNKIQALLKPYVQKARRMQRLNQDEMPLAASRRRSSGKGLYSRLY